MGKPTMISTSDSLLIVMGCMQILDGDLAREQRGWRCPAPAMSWLSVLKPNVQIKAVAHNIDQIAEH